MQVIQRYGGRCVVCDNAVTKWLHAAHLAGDAESGSSDPRNGLPFCSNHHAAFDRGLISIDPDDGRIYLRGYSAADMNLTHRDLLRAKPARDALKFRWDQRETGGWAPVL